MRFPDFIIVGASKSGTTSLYHYLKQHPSVFMPENKEPHYFAPAKWCGLQVPSRDDYLKLFDRAGSNMKAGEASTGYLYYPQSPDLIHAEIPDCHIVAILRNPVDRAFSGYCHEVSLGMEQVSFEQALKEEKKKLRRRNGDEFSFNYMKQGFVFDLLVRYVELFGAENVHICFFDDLVQAPTELMRALFRFISVDEEFRGDWSYKHNATGDPGYPWLSRWISTARGLEQAWMRMGKRLIPSRLRPKIRRRLVDWNIARGSRLRMNDDTRSMLERLYAEEIEKIESLTGRNLAHWKSSMIRHPETASHLIE
ncbi:MAG: sulfotransferase family protein [Gammaproteobacteria bacterium]